MSDEPVRKLVKPAHSGARIPDPAHPGLCIAQDGTEVVWDHYWIGRERRGEIIIVEPTESTPLVEEASTVAEPEKAGIPFMITNAMREQLRERGVTDEKIAQMTPEAANAELAKPAPQAG